MYLYINFAQFSMKTPILINILKIIIELMWLQCIISKLNEKKLGENEDDFRN